LSWSGCRLGLNSFAIDGTEGIFRLLSQTLL
jgi:hypothetical protein